MPAALWHLIRLEQPAPGAVELVCDTGFYPATATLYDSANGVYEVVTACFPLNEPDVCAQLNVLDAYSPNDWTTECP